MNSAGKFSEVRPKYAPGVFPSQMETRLGAEVKREFFQFLSLSSPLWVYKLSLNVAMLPLLLLLIQEGRSITTALRRGCKSDDGIGNEESRYMAWSWRMLLKR